MSLMRKNPPFVQCKVELESTVASLRHILISPGVRRGLSQSGEERQGKKLGATAVRPGPSPPFVDNSLDSNSSWHVPRT